MVASGARQELKFLLPFERMERIWTALAPVCRPDRHSGQAGYRVVSLYFDSPGLDCFWDKIEGERHRRKLRLRIYPGDDRARVSEAAVEIKQRAGRSVIKRRVILPLAEAQDLCRGRQPATALDDGAELFAAEVGYQVSALDLRPTAVTAYRRRALVFERAESPVRITFDTGCAGRVRLLDVTEPARGHPFLPLDWGVLEIKVDRAVPAWLASLLSSHGCRLQRISKYCAALAAGKGIRVEPLAVWPAVPRGEPADG